MKLKLKKMRHTAILPEFKTDGAVAMDFYASLEGLKPGTKGLGDREFVLLPGEIVAIPLGVAVQLEPGHELRIRPRSSMLLKGVSMASYDLFEDEEKSGTIDTDYRGEVHAILHNTSTKAFIISEGSRVCQGIITKVECPGSGLEMELVEELDQTERGDKGFGHTGK